MTVVSISKDASSPVLGSKPSAGGVTAPGQARLSRALPVPPSQRRLVGRLVVPPKRYKVGELAAVTGLSRQTLHNYTKWGLIGESGWTDGGHRLYDESVFAQLERVMRLKTQMTVERVRELLEREARESRQAEEQAA